MDPEFWFNVAMRWLHIAAAALGVGGTLLLRLVVLPVLSGRPDGEAVLEAMRRPLKRAIHTALGLLLLTGFYNYLVVAMPAVRERAAAGHPLPGYHAVMGIKILLSGALIVLAILLLKPAPGFRENPKSWLSVNVLLGLLILLLGAYLRRLW